MNNRDRKSIISAQIRDIQNSYKFIEIFLEALHAQTVQTDLRPNKSKDCGNIDMNCIRIKQNQVYLIAAINLEAAPTHE